MIWYLLLGAILIAPAYILATLWYTRRTWRNARRMIARAKGQDQLVELGQLAAGLAHEIKNPLSTVNVNLALLAEDLERMQQTDNGRSLRRLQHVQGETARLKQILDDFLRFAGRVELTLSSVDLRRLVDELVDFFSPQADSARVVIRTSLPDQPVRCLLDENLVKQAVLNLMINAVHAMDQGGELLLRVTSDSDRALLEVIDTGSGISADQMQKIFTAYYSTKPTGTGLGLPMTRRIVLEHGGTIRAESEPGKGTRFILTLPLADR